MPSTARLLEVHLSFFLSLSFYRSLSFFLSFFLSSFPSKLIEFSVRRTDQNEDELTKMSTS